MTAPTENTSAAAAQAQADILAASKHADPERADLLAELANSRHFLRFTTRGLTDEQARQRTTASELSLGGLIKHVADTTGTWTRYLTEGPAAMPDFANLPPEFFEQRGDRFRLAQDETLQGVLDDYERISAAADEAIRTVGDLNTEHPLPNAPWFPPGATWTVRRAILHIISETTQHAGHADIIREGIDGAKSMG